MIEKQSFFKRYVSDTSGAFAVLFVLVFGFIWLSVQVGVSAFKVQNPATAAEHLADIACQKILTADPALYPTPDDVVTAGLNALNARNVRGVNATEGSFSITYAETDPNYVVPIKADRSNADLRRFEFTVTYTGKAYGLNRMIAPSGTTDVAVTKKCRPICTGMTNIVYSNGTALGHWMKGNVLKAAQYVDDQGKNIDRFVDVSFDRGASNPGKDNDRLIMTIYQVLDDGQKRIRMRELIQLPTSFYLDNDRRAVPGEPSTRSVRRYVVTEDDQVAIQTLNADGSLPGVCGPDLTPDDAVCSDPACSGSVEAPPPVEAPPKFECVFPDLKPSKRPIGPYPDITFANHQIEFNYPPGDGTPGKMTIKWIGQKTRIVTVLLAPNYVPNPATGRVRFADGTFQITAEQASVYSYLRPGLGRWRIFFPTSGFPDHKYLVFLTSWNMSWWWDGKDNCFRFKSPIVFDTHNLGQIITTRSSGASSLEREPYFNYFGTGEKARVEWPIGEGQAWLVDNRDGRAAEDMSGKRFFGDLDGHNDGYAKLRELDTSGTGILSGRDLEGLALWFDNGNAIVESGELKSLAEVGITSVDTRAEWQTLADGRPVLRASAMMQGRQIMTEDVFVEISTKATPVEAALQTSDQRGAQ